MKVLVTGAAGFIGSHLVDLLIEKGYEVTCFVRDDDDLIWLEGKDIEIVFGDCTDKQSLYPALDDDIDFIFHLAGVKKARLPREYHTCNFGGTKNILEACLERELELKRFIFTSSVTVMGPCDTNKPLCGSDECRPINEYSRSKLEAENLLREHRGKIPFTILRLGVVYGPRDPLGLYPLFKFASRGIKQGSIKVKSNPIYVKDVVRCLLLSATREEALYQTYLVGGDVIISADEFADIISEIMGVRTLTIRTPLPLLYVLSMILQICAWISRTQPLLDIRRLRDLKHRLWIYDSSLIRKELGYSPRYDLRTGIEETVDWYRKAGWINLKHSS